MTHLFEGAFQTQMFCALEIILKSRLTWHGFNEGKGYVRNTILIEAVGDGKEEAVGDREE